VQPASIDESVDVGPPLEGATVLNEVEIAPSDRRPTMPRRFFLACTAALFACMTPIAGAAQTPDKQTLFTFSGPVTMPGITLPAGTYLFRLANPTAGRDVVQVMSADGRTLYGMFLSQPGQQREPAPTPGVRFLETADGMPAAIQAWWYPGQRTGHVLIYPREQARRLALGSDLRSAVTDARIAANAPVSGAAAPGGGQS
jgi:hypothetical protein